MFPSSRHTAVFCLHYTTILVFVNTPNRKSFEIRIDHTSNYKTYL